MIWEVRGLLVLPRYLSGRNVNAINCRFDCSTNADVESEKAGREPGFIVGAHSLSAYISNPFCLKKFSGRSR
jgi:hypothetical protein